MTREIAPIAVEEPGHGAASTGSRRRLLGLGLAALGYLFLARVDWHELVATVAGCDLRRVPQILAAQLLFVALGGLALWLLAGGRHDVRLPAFLAAYWRCVAVGFWTPAASGELTLAWFLRPHGLPLREGLALVTLDKIVTTLAVAALALPAAGWMASRLDMTADAGGFLLAACFLVLVVAALVAALLALARKRGAPRLLALLQAGRGYVVSLRGLVLASPARLAGNLALTLLRVTVGALVLWWSVAAFSPGWTSPSRAWWWSPAPPGCWRWSCPRRTASASDRRRTGGGPRRGQSQAAREGGLEALAARGPAAGPRRR